MLLKQLLDAQQTLATHHQRHFHLTAAGLVLLIKQGAEIGVIHNLHDRGGLREAR